MKVARRLWERNEAPGGLGRTLRLANAFRLESTDPDAFNSVQAADVVAQVRRYVALEGLRVLDIGGGAGYFTRAFNTAGAYAVLVEPSAGRASPYPHEPGPPTSRPSTMPVPVIARVPPARHHRSRVEDTRPRRPGRLAPGCTVAGDGRDLPLAGGVADLVFCANVLEHVANTEELLTELVRVARCGGLIYLSFTTWYSLWGGHETAPWHLLGGERAALRYERKTGQPPTNRFGESLFARHAGATLRHVHNRSDVTVVDAMPRYHPDWLRWLVRVPALREFAVWNLLLVLRRIAQ